MTKSKKLFIAASLFSIFACTYSLQAAPMQEMAIKPIAKTSAPSPDNIISETGSSNIEMNKVKKQALSGYWMRCKNQYHYQYEDGNYISNTWSDINNKRYYFDENGNMKTDWYNDGTYWYYLGTDGSLKNGWTTYKDSWYYLDANGVMSTGWVEDNNKKYYLDNDGIMQTGWITAEDKRYYLSEDGVLTTGWVEDNGAYYYLTEDSTKTTGWLKLDNKYYFLNSDGIMQTGWILDQNKPYYLDADGVLDSNATKPTKTGQVIALTFDDGPGKYTDRLLDTLERSKAKATFFLLGNQIPSYTKTVKRMETLGCQIGSHTYDHTDLKKLDAAAIKTELDKTTKAFNDALGHAPTLIRPPYGSYNEGILKTLGLPSIMWSLDTLDWKTLNAQSTIHTVLDTVKNGDIILMHDIHKTSVEAAEILIPVLIAKGYKLVTVSELAASKGKTLEVGKSYNSFP